MEFVGYIFVGYIVLRIIGWFVEFFSSQKEISIEELSNDVVKWFIERYPIRKKSPRIVISNKKSDYDGDYSFYNNSITLYNKNLDSYNKVVEIMLHEMTHWYLITSQSKDLLYEKQLNEYGYENHPQEIMCRTMAHTLKEIYIKEHS